MDFLKQAKVYEKELIAMRRHLHENPEVSDKEFNTLDFIKGKLDEYKAKFVETRGGLLVFLGDEAKGKTVLLRADIDALPLNEDPNNLKGPKDCISKIPNVCHACGHDGHTSMMLITIKMLKEVEADLKGRVIVAFERGEEMTNNYRHLFKYIFDNNVKIDTTYATHLYSAHKAGKISAEPGGVMASVMGYEVKISGKSGHGSRPDLANNPMDCFAAFHAGFMALRMKYITPFDLLTSTIGSLHSGAQGNIIPDDLEFKGSIRIYNSALAPIYKKEFLNLLDNVTKSYNCTYTVNDMYEPLFPCMNHPDAAAFVKKNIVEKMGEQYYEKCDPWMASESYSLYLKMWPGVLCFLGINNPELGSGAEHHNKHFDLDESVLHIGAAASAVYAFEYLAQNPTYAETGHRYTGTIMELLKEKRGDDFSNVV